METACSVLTLVSTSRSTTNTNSSSNMSLSHQQYSNEGNIAVRDAMYGTLCVLCRSSFLATSDDYPLLYALGKNTTTTSGDYNNNDNTQKIISMDTAQLLFKCAANEEEVLRPRAMAALDALLAAYCQKWQNNNNQTTKNNATFAAAIPQQQQQQTEVSAMPNPWLPQPETQHQPTTTAHDTSMAESSSSSLPSSSSSQLLVVAPQKLLPMLWSASQSQSSKHSRVAAVRWTSELLKGLDLEAACHLLCYQAGDSDITVSNIAQTSLGIHSLHNNNKTNNTKSASSSSSSQPKPSSTTINGENNDADEDDNKDIPEFSSFVQLLFGPQQQRSSSSRPTYWDFSTAGKGAAIQFALVCLLSDIYGSDNEDQAVDLLVAALVDTIPLATKLEDRHTISLLDEVSVGLATCMSSCARGRFLLYHGQLSLSLQDFEQLALQARSSKARRHFAALCLHLFNDTALWGDTTTGGSDGNNNHWIKELEHVMKQCSEMMKDCATKSGGPIHGAAFLGGSCIQTLLRLEATTTSIENTNSSVCWDLCATLIQNLGEGLLNPDESIGNAYANAISIAFDHPNITASAARGNHKIHENVHSAIAMTVEKIAAALNKFGCSSDHANVTRAFPLCNAAGHALAISTQCLLGTTLTEQLGSSRISCVDALLAQLGSTAYRKDDELALAAGEALALYGDVPPGLSWDSEMEVWPTDLDTDFANQLPPHQQVVYNLLRRSTVVSNPLKRTACAPALLAVVARAARHVNRDKANIHGNKLVACISSRLDEIQIAFITLLADPKAKHLSRESCCLGFAACKTLAQARDSKATDDLASELNKKLLSAFGQTQNFGTSAMMETPEQARQRRQANGTNPTNTAQMLLDADNETRPEVGGVAGLGEAALGAYREMAEAAVSLGRPDVLYALLLLSVSHSAWNTESGMEKYSAAVLIGEEANIGSNSGIREMRVALRPHLQKLLPRMLRACHDPNQQTRDQMSNLFVGLTGGGAEARQTISDNLISTIDTLIQDSNSKLWRARVGACGALSQVIVGRSWTELGGGEAAADDEIVMMLDSKIPSAGAGVRLLRLWRSAMRALDDVRGAVRDSGQTLARGVKALTMRLCDLSLQTDPSDDQGDPVKAEKNATAAATTALSWLVKHGLNQPCPEATGVCVSCLVGIVEVSPAKVVQPILPELIRLLLLAISGLEPAALNFLQVRAAGGNESSLSFERLERLRLQMAQTGPLANAVTKCLEMVPNTSIETQKAVVFELDSALRQSAGFASRAATADAVSNLSSTSPQAFKFAGSSTGNPAVRLLRALYYASEREFGQGAKEKMAHALGNLAAVCPASSVLNLAVRACNRYNASTGSNDDPMARRASAIAVRSIAIRASHHFNEGGKGETWCRRVLPVAFLGKSDPESKVADLWREVWEEGGSAASFENFGSSQEEKLLPYLVVECCEAISDVSWARRVRGASAIGELGSSGILAPPPRTSRGNADPERWERRCLASRSSLLALLQCVTKTRVWSGKVDVMKAISSVTAKWAAAMSDPNYTEGITNEKLKMPFVFSSGKSENDLLIGDGWFDSENMEEKDSKCLSETEPVVGMEVDEHESKKIDFEEGDRLLEDTDAEEGVSSSSMRVDDKNANEIINLLGLCRELTFQAFPRNPKSTFLVSAEELLPYRAACLESLASIISSFGDNSQSDAMKRTIFNKIAPQLVSLVSSTDMGPGKESPLMQARAWNVLGACFWGGFGENPEDNLQELMTAIKTNCGLNQVAWSVREAAASACADLCTHIYKEGVRDHHLVSAFVDCSIETQKDRKFYKVRLGGMKILRALIDRAGKSQNDKGRDTLILESLLPMKETMMALTRKALQDSESKVSALATDVLTTMNWWP